MKPGKHHFEFEVDEKFLAEFEYSLVKNGELKVDLELDKQETMLILDFHIRGNIFLECDLCLAPFPFGIELKERQIAKFSNEDGDGDEEILVVNRNEHEIDVSGLIYEYINLAVPYTYRCNDEGNTSWCDTEMIAKLNSLSGPTEKKEEIADPRWEALKKIKNKN